MTARHSAETRTRIEEDGPSEAFASMGFEWDLKDVGVTGEDGEDLPPKFVIAANPDHGIRAENDSGHVELITDPIDSRGFILVPDRPPIECGSPKAALERQLAALDSMKKDLIKRKQLNVTCSQRIAALQGTKISSVCLTSSGKTVSGRPQATVGIRLQRIPKMMVLPYVKAQKQVGHVRKSCPGAENQHPDAFGLLCILQLYYGELKNTKPGDKDGPKQVLSMVARHSFRGMFIGLEGAQRSYFENCLRESIRSDEDDAPLCPNGYFNEVAAIPAEFSPTWNEWVLSILDPSDGCQRYLERIAELSSYPECDDPMAAAEEDSFIGATRTSDLVSPLPFFNPTPEGGIAYSMGRFGEMSGALALFEFRNFSEVNLALSGVAKAVLKLAGCLFDPNE